MSVSKTQRREAPQLSITKCCLSAGQLLSLSYRKPTQLAASQETVLSRPINVLGHELTAVTENNNTG